MRTIGEVAYQELVWAQPARLQRAYELRASEDVVATLRFEGASLASGVTAWKRWTFKREGFWHPRVTIRGSDSGDNVSVFKAAWTGGGALDLPQGRLLRFAATNFLRSQWDWADTEAGPLVHFKRQAGLMKMEGQVEIETKAVTDPELPLLLVLGWYLVILSTRNAAAAAVTVH